MPAANQFDDLRRCQPILTRFETSSDLLAHLASPSGDLDEKDQIYVLLVRAVKARSPCARLAHALLWCGLWPGLDRLYRRRLRYFQTEPDELSDAISAAFTTLVGQLDLARVHRVAATLVRSTDREVMDERRRLMDDLAHRVDDAGATIARTVSPTSGAGGTFDTGLSRTGRLRALRARLVPVVGADAELILAVLVLDFDQHEAATLLGLSHEAARKRLQRALARLRAFSGSRG